MFGFDHDASELLRTGIAENDAAVLAKSGSGFREGARDLGKRFERRLRSYFDVDDGLRVVLEAFDERFDFAAHGNERSDFDGGEKTIASGTIFQKNDVAGLLASKDIAAAEHFLEHVAITYWSASEDDVFPGEGALEAKIGHGSSNYAVALEFVLRFKVTRDGQKYPIAVDNFSSLANKESTVGITVEGDPKLGTLVNHTLLQTLKMKGTAAIVDVAAVWRDAHRDNIGTQGAEQFGAKFVGGAVCTIQNDAKAGKGRARE